MAMEVTAGSFEALFKIVQAQIAEQDAPTDSAAVPKRALRRRKSDQYAPQDSPNGKRYFIAARGGWNRLEKIEGITPVSVSGSSNPSKRRLTRTEKSSRANRAPKVRAGGERRVTAKQVLGEDYSPSCHSRGGSRSE